MNIKSSFQMLNIRVRQRGLTLIEIMVALLIGIFLLAGVIQIFIANRQTYRVQENLSRMQENGRFAMYYLSRYIRLAGYVPNLSYTNSDDKNRSNLVDIVEDTFPSLDESLTDIMATTAIRGNNNSGLNNSDEISVRFKTDPENYNPLTDCFGSEAGRQVKVTNRFFLKNLKDKDNNDQPVLYCDPKRTAGNDPVKDPARDDPEQPIIEGVENMQIRYCERFNNDSNSSLRCVTADKVSDWNKVQSVRISLLVRSADDSLVGQPQPYQWDADGDGEDDPPLTPTDRRLRRVFTTTIIPRNLTPY